MYKMHIRVDGHRFSTTTSTVQDNTKTKARIKNIEMITFVGRGFDQSIIYLQLPLTASNITQFPVELVDAGGEAALEVGIANAWRVGSSHSLLIVLIVSNVPILEEVEIEGALGLLVLFSGSEQTSTRLRFRFSLRADELVLIEELATLDVSDIEVLAILGAIGVLSRIVSVLVLRFKVFSSILKSSSLSLWWQKRRSSQRVLGRGRALVLSNTQSVASMAK